MSPQFEIALRLLVGLSFWVTTLLIVALMIKQALEWWAVAFPFAPVRWYQARIVAGSREGQELARMDVNQVGRALLDSQQAGILFNDISRRAFGFGGRAEIGQQAIEIAFRQTEPALWLDSEAFDHEMIGVTFAESLQASKGPHGLKRTLEGKVRVGDQVWLRGKLRADQVLECDVVSSFEPRARSVRSGVMLLVCAVSTVIAASGITWATVAVSPEALQSKIAGGVGLVFFLLVQPFGVWTRDYFALPHRSRLDGLAIKGSQTATVDGR